MGNSASHGTSESSDRRDHILDVAERLFADRGFAATSMRQIANAAGVNVATLYYHCDNKEHLFLALHERVIATMAAIVSEALSEGRDFLQLAEKLMDSVVDFLARNPAICRLLVRSDLGELNTVRGSIRSTSRPLYQLVYGELKHRADRGEIRRVDPATFLAGATGAIFYMLMALHQRSEDGKVDERALKLVQEQARHFVFGAVVLDATASGAKSGSDATTAGEA